jgi:hypothetical protein
MARVHKLGEPWPRYNNDSKRHTHGCFGEHALFGLGSLYHAHKIVDNERAIERLRLPPHARLRVPGDDGNSGSSSGHSASDTQV